MALVYWVSDGGGRGVGDVPTVLSRWIRQKGSPCLIVNGGDIYKHGRPKDFAAFLSQMDNDTTLMCEVPGNHDYETVDQEDLPRIPTGYDEFWTSHAPPESRQPINATLKGGARYEHFIDLEGWRLIFLDTGDCKKAGWPMGDPQRLARLSSAITTVPGRSKIVMAHHSRLSFGNHGDNPSVDTLWRTLFDRDTGAPLVACTLSGHDHNVSLYHPRPSAVSLGRVPPEQGIHVLVNGAGGDGHYTDDDGTEPDILHDNVNYCVTRINLIDARSADIDVLSFGASPKFTTEPKVLEGSLIRFRF
jgi:hypothetical protein